MDQKSGQENMAVVERWPLWGGFQLQDLSEWIRSRGKKTWPLKRGGRCREVAVSGVSTVRQSKLSRTIFRMWHS